MAMLPIPTTYTSYTQAQEHFVQVLEQVELGNSIVIVQRQGHNDVALIAADELSAALLNQGMNDNLAPIQKLVWV